jgi:hypothetical protein
VPRIAKSNTDSSRIFSLSDKLGVWQLWTPKMDLDTTRILVTLLAILLATPLVRIVTTWFRLRHVPGPTSAGFHKLWLLGAVTGGQTHTLLHEATRFYGPLVRVGPRDVVTSDLELIRRINDPRSGYRRADSYLGQRVHPDRDSILSQRDSALHDALRARVAAGHAPAMLARWEERVDRQVSALAALIGDRYTGGRMAGETKAFDLAKKISFFAMDVVVEVVFGQAPGFLKTDSDVYEYIRRTRENMAINLFVTAWPVLNWVKRTEFIKKWFVPQAGDRDGMGKIIGCVALPSCPACTLSASSC